MAEKAVAVVEAASVEVEGIECWSAREMQNLIGYGKWENFEKVIQKAKDSCKNAGEQVSDHFPDVRKTIRIGSDTDREIDDIALTRYACYLHRKLKVDEKKHNKHNGK